MLADTTGGVDCYFNGLSEVDQLERANEYLRRRQAQSLQDGNAVGALRFSRDRSLLLLGFWRAFRSDELTRLRIEDVEVIAGRGLTCRLHRSKGDREFKGRTFHCPAVQSMPTSNGSRWLD